MKKSILIVGNFDFPNGNASSNLIENDARIFRNIGYNVVFIGCSRKQSKSVPLLDTKIIRDNFIGYNYHYPSNILEWIKWKEKYNQFLIITKTLTNLKYVVLYATPCISIFLKKVINYCKKNHIKVITRIVDWIPETKGNIFTKIGKVLDSNYRIKYINKKSDGIIAVSKYLYNYYIKYCTNVIVVPPLVDSKNYPKCNMLTSNKIVKLIYFGEPFPVSAHKCSVDNFKDRIDKVIDILLKTNCNNYILDIYGVKKQDYLKFVPEDYEKINNNNNIHFYGKISRNNLLNKIINYDFLIFLRDSNQMTNAGFPSKLSEAFGCGLPTITTNTSDISEYIIDGENGYLIDINDAKKMRQILENDRKKINELKTKVLNYNSFDYHNYVEKYSDFLERI